MVHQKYLLCDDPVENVISENGEVTGFRFKMRWPSYKGERLSYLNDIKVIIDGEEFNGTDVTVTLASGTFTTTDYPTMAWHFWNFNEKGTITVKKPGGLNPGKHSLEAGMNLRGFFGVMHCGTPDGYCGGAREFEL